MRTMKPTRQMLPMIIHLLLPFIITYNHTKKFLGSSLYFFKLFIKIDVVYNDYLYRLHCKVVLSYSSSRIKKNRFIRPYLDADLINVLAGIASRFNSKDLLSGLVTNCRGRKYRLSCIVNREYGTSDHVSNSGWGCQHYKTVFIRSILL